MKSRVKSLATPCVTEVPYYKTDERLDMEISFFVIILPNMNSPDFGNLYDN